MQSADFQKNLKSIQRKIVLFSLTLIPEGVGGWVEVILA